MPAPTDPATVPLAPPAATAAPLAGREAIDLSESVAGEEDPGASIDLPPVPRQPAAGAPAPAAGQPVKRSSGS